MQKLDIAEAVGGAFGFAIAAAINFAIGAFISIVFLSYWTWFVEPLGLPRIGFFHAWGLVIMSGLIIPTQQIVGNAEERLGHAKKALARVFFAWPFGFALHLLTT